MFLFILLIFLIATTAPATEDDFDDFVSASGKMEALDVNDDNSFTDFQQASSPKSTPSSNLSLTKAKKGIDSSDLMSLEQDKYSVFRELNLATDEPEKEPELATTVPANPENKDLFSPENPSVVVEFQADFSNIDSKVADDDNFGDFTFCAEVSNKTLHAAASQRKMEAISVAETQSNSSFEFGNFDSAESSKQQASFTDSQSIASLELDPVFFQTEAKLLKKDNISLGENQSVASLEFGSFSCDLGGQSSDSKSPISKSDSMPSLDLKVTSPDIGDDEFGEMISANIKSNAEPRPVDASFVLQNSSNSSFFVDKYSSVRINDQVFMLRFYMIIS